MNLRTAKHDDGFWWVDGLPAFLVAGTTCTCCGPYHTKAEADSDRRGMERFYRDHPECDRE